MQAAVEDYLGLYNSRPLERSKSRLAFYILMNSYKKILKYRPFLPWVKILTTNAISMVDSYLVAHLGLIAISGVSVAGISSRSIKLHLLALGAAVASVMSKSLGEKIKKNIAYHATESLECDLIVECSLREGHRCYLDAR